MGQTASVPTDRKRKLEVIGAGFSRTGTLSYAFALEKLLDGPVHHTGTQLLKREDAYCKKWNLVYQHQRNGERKQLLAALEDVFAGFVGATDTTAFDFLPELMELYPDAKVVLVTRNQEAWWRSFKVVADNAGSKLMGYITMPLPGVRWFIDTARGFFEAAEDRTGHECNPHWIEQHNDYVRRLVPRDRLLEVELGSGWEPLCKFLGKPIPKEPFPRVNEAAARDKFMQRILLKAAVAWTGIFAAVGLMSYSSWRFWRLHLESIMMRYTDMI
ncbi:nad dependent epimerase dehydratase [Trichoderma arundinaceum]|uniref:Nad dependent epimerase dehydratase n=1 Tax=Trichoderma arundinaceum TaxID=490622 RepID=A0A395NZN1_TRIAR|nr:nad dependent epimerase dehydratase [Trichoderma arundinaceum]